MLSCPVCDAPSPDGYQYCGQCGSPLASLYCPSCGAGNASGQRFCGRCGSSLDGTTAPARAPAVEERKLATVLFADVVGFTSLAERTDHELVARMVDRAFRRLGEVVVEYGGAVDKYMGDSVMAVFGVPVAHDDDAERAVAAALAMRSLGGDLAFSIGINSGEVMATAVGAGGDMTVIGDTVNVAARLEKVAGPGEVLCGRLTADLASRRVEFRHREPVLLKGKREPVDVFEAVAIRPLGSTPDDGPLLVGRADELAFLGSQWRRVCAEGRARVVLLCGDPGVGKTRLLDELTEVARRDGAVARATYPAYGPMGGIGVATELIRQLGLTGDSEIDARVRSIAGELDSSLQAIDPAGLRQEQMWALGKLLQEKVMDEPLLLVFDDMHRGGEGTLGLLAELSGRLGSVPVLTVLAGRPDPPEWLAKFPTATTIRLAPLGDAETRALAAAFVRDRPLSDAAADFLAQRSAGNPLYMRELVAVARATGALVDDGSSYRLTTDAVVPATLQALLAARLDALDPSHKLVLQHVAVFGGAANDERVEALGSSEARSIIKHLVDDGLLVVGHDGTYDAADSLLREVAYETLPRQVRGELHRRAAELVERPEERARHLDRAAGYLPDDRELIVAAAEALASAGQELLASGRHLDAYRLLERSVDLGCSETSVLLAYAGLQSTGGENDAALATLGRIPDDPDDPGVAVERDHVAANAKAFADPGLAERELVEVAARWHAIGNETKRGWAHSNRGVALFNLSRMEESGSELETGLAIFESLGERSAAVATSAFLCLVKPADRRVPLWLAEALDFADASGDRTRQVTTLTTLSWHHFLRSLCGAPEETLEAETFARRLADLADELGAGELAIHGLSHLTVIARMSARFELAAAAVADLQSIAARPGHNDAWFGWAASFAHTVSSGASSAAPPFPPADSVDPVVGMARVVIGAELTLAGRLDEAVDSFGIVDRPNIGPISEMAGLLYGLALLLEGEVEQARGWVEAARDAAISLGAAPVLRAASALLAEITGDVTALEPWTREPRSLSGLLVLRAYAATGDAAAMDALPSACAAFAAPGIMSGL